MARFAAYGKQGWARARAGDLAGADASFRAQIAIFPGNFEPYVGRALTAAGRRDHDLALAQVREAVLRGFTDFPRLDRSEQWHRLRRNETYLGLLDSVPRLQELESRWPAWKQLRTGAAPKDLATALADRAALDATIGKMAPALGPRLVRVWLRMSARATAARLETYVAARTQAPDFQKAIEHLIELYAGPAVLRWEVLPFDTAQQLRKVTDLAVQRLPDGPSRNGALLFSALARNAERNWKGVLAPAAVEPILTTLDRVLAANVEPGYLALAAEGSIRVELEAGRLDRAGERYLRFRREHASDTALLDLLRDRLGTLALQLGGLPAFTARTLDGEPFASETLAGKVAVVDFWATWCKPCLEELPTLRKIQERHGEEVVLLGVSLDGGDDLPADALRAWTVREKVPGRQLHDGGGWESELVRSFGVREIPFSVVIAPDGSVVAIGERGKKLERAVEAALRAARH